MKILNNQEYFTAHLLEWNANGNTREMPWKGEKDPYRIWLSEIILQQTRVSQGLDYYNRFIKEFPTIGHLARATETKAFKLWEGLGYYTRCKNLLATAKYINDTLKGEFPKEYDNILMLKGIGPYTAAAIASFAFNLPYAVVDGNVFRVLSRYFGLSVPIDSSKGKKHFTQMANSLLDKRHPGIYNQALMDFGAVICKPQLPLCANCMLQVNCVAFLKGAVQQLPVKEKSIIKRTRYFYYLLICFNEDVYIRKRGSGDIWENLYEFFLIESPEVVAPANIEKLAELIGKNDFIVTDISPLYKQQLTHQTIKGQFIIVKIKEPFVIKGYKIIGKKALQKLPFPKFISAYLKDKNVSLNLFLD